MIWRYLLRPLAFSLPAESTHYLAMNLFVASTLGPVGSLLRRCCRVDDPRLHTELFGLKFSNPVGLAAGFDKDARWFNPLSNLGFGHIEIGTLTALAQPGNEKPRLFRLPADQALVNRMGFNNSGSAFAAERFNGKKIRPILGINIGKSKVTELEKATEDYLVSLRRVYPYASYITLNVSSPNTPGLRQLQGRESLLELLTAVMNEGRELAAKYDRTPVPVLLKIAPDMNEEQLDDVCEILEDLKVDGIIATNTTIERSALKTDPSRVQAIGAGGLSGAPLTSKSRQVVRHFYRNLGGKIPIVGVGGIMNPEDAWQMILAGASMVQVYTGFIYGGPFFVRNINHHLASRLAENGFDRVADAVGKGNSE